MVIKDIQSTRGHYAELGSHRETSTGSKMAYHTEQWIMFLFQFLIKQITVETHLISANIKRKSWLI